MNRLFEIPLNNSGVTEFNLINFLSVYLTQLLNSQSPYGNQTSQNFFKALLTLPPIWFQANGDSNNTQQVSNIPLPGLPSELYVVANLAKSETRIVISQWTVIIFVILGVGVYAWSIALLGWGMGIQGPRIGPFRLVDFASRVASAGMAEASLAHAISKAAGASDVRLNLEQLRLFLREQRLDQVDEMTNEGELETGEMTGASKTIGFSTKAAGYQKLKLHDMYR